MRSDRGRRVADVARPHAAAQSLTYTKGQNVAPAFEGWEQDADGSKWFVFGYMNRNWVEEIDVPPGPDNTITPGGPDAGQPTHFLPRRNRFVFRVAVPKTFTEKDEMIWTLTTHGSTEKACATLRLDYLLDHVVKASETGALGAGTSSPEVRSNQPPTVTVEGAKTLTAKVGQPLTLTAVVKDDGIPKPPATANPLAALFGGAPAPPRRARPVVALVAVAERRHRRHPGIAAVAARGPERTRHSAGPQGRRGCVRHLGDSAATAHHRPSQSRHESACAHHGGQDHGLAPVVVCLSRFRQGHLLAGTGQALGGHPCRDELALGTVVDSSGVARGRQDRGPGDLCGAGHLRAESVG